MYGVRDIPTGKAMQDGGRLMGEHHLAVAGSGMGHNGQQMAVPGGTAEPRLQGAIDPAGQPSESTLTCLVGEDFTSLRIPVGGQEDRVGVAGLGSGERGLRGERNKTGHLSMLGGVPPAQPPRPLPVGMRQSEGRAVE